MIFRPPTDDQGQRLPPLSLSSLRQEDDEQSKARHELARRLAASTASTRQLTGAQVAVVLGCGAALLLVVVMVINRMGSGWGLTFGLAGIVLIGLAVARVGRAEAARSLSATAVSEGFCGGCGYTLHTLEAAGEFVRCPECGAAWRPSRITRPHWRSQERSPEFVAPLWLRVVGLVPTGNTLQGTDDRECITRYIDSRLLLIAPENRGGVSAELRRQLCKRCRAPGLWLRLLGAAVIGLPGVLAAYGALSSAFDSPHVDWFLVFVAALAVLLFGGGAVGILLSSSGIKSEHPARVLLRARLCGSCGKNLTGLAPDPDGCTVCPHCRAAWRMPAADSCGACGYSLAGLTEPICPECGERWRV